MKIELSEETAIAVTIEQLEKIYDNYYEELENLIQEDLSPDEVKGIFSFNPEEEVFRLIDLLNSLTTAINLFESDFNSGVQDLLETKNLSLFQSTKDYQSLKKQKEELVIELGIVSEELTDLKTKVRKLFPLD